MTSADCLLHETATRVKATSAAQTLIELRQVAMATPPSQHSQQLFSISLCAFESLAISVSADEPLSQDLGRSPTHM
jgi:hypothetical protein